MFNKYLKLKAYINSRLGIDGIYEAAVEMAPNEGITVDWCYLQTKLGGLFRSVKEMPEALPQLKADNPESQTKLLNLLERLFIETVECDNTDYTTNLESHDFFGFNTPQEDIDPLYFSLFADPEPDVFLSDFHQFDYFYQSRKPFLAQWLDQVGSTIDWSNAGCVALLSLSFFSDSLFDCHCLHEFVSMDISYDYVVSDLKKFFELHSSCGGNFLSFYQQNIEAIANIICSETLENLISSTSQEFVRSLSASSESLHSSITSGKELISKTFLDIAKHLPGPLGKMFVPVAQSFIGFTQGISLGYFSGGEGLVNSVSIHFFNVCQQFGLFSHLEFASSLQANMGSVPPSEVDVSSLASLSSEPMGVPSEPMAVKVGKAAGYLTLVSLGIYAAKYCFG